MPDPQLTRRELFQIGGCSFGAVQAAGSTTPRGTARFCIFIMLDGGQSHVDAWDLKEGKWTPPDFDVKEARPGVKWPMALYPRLAAQLDRFTLARSVAARESVHGRAQYHVQAAHSFHPAFEREIPPVGSVVAMELASQWHDTGCLPPYVALNVTQSQAGLLRSGFLPQTCSPFHIDASTGISAYGLSDADRTRYGNTITGDAAILARNMVEADAGTRFIFLQQSGWDHHKDIYNKANHYRLSVDLDNALASLLEDLAARRRADGRTLLDETMVVCMGEFGRTPGGLTSLNGRDHYPYAFTALFAGGGVKGGQILGKTDETGARVIDTGWNRKRSIFMEDIAATIYSALGIDWTKTIRRTPSGREFHYAVAGSEVSALFG
jgi:hypothetical protein